jgi:hypothetical protein
MTTTAFHCCGYQRILSSCVQLKMVRNIDLPEAIVFYGLHSIIDTKDDNPLPGVESLLKECQEIQAASILLTTNNEETGESLKNLEELYNLKVFFDTEHLPPNPRALFHAIESTAISPKGFGGSSGFGTKMPEPERCPLAKHVVVLAKTLDECRAARFFGARVMCLIDNDLADGIVDSWTDIGIDDISTPGSYWLNPPFGSRDDEGNRVDIFEVMKVFETSLSPIHDDSSNLESQEDDEWLAILNDIEGLV